MSNASSTDLECAPASNRFKVDEAVDRARRSEHRFAASSGSSRRRTEHSSHASHLSPSTKSLLLEINCKKAEAQTKINELLASTKLLDKMKVCVSRVQQGIDLSQCQRLQSKIAPLLKVDNISQKDGLNKVQALLTRHVKILQEMELIKAEALLSPDQCKTLQAKVATLIGSEDIRHPIVKEVKKLLARGARTLEPNQSWNNTPVAKNHSYQGILSSKYISLINRFTAQDCTQIVDLLIEYVEKAPPANSIIQDLSDYSYNDDVFRSLDIKDQADLLTLVVNSHAPADALCDIQKIIAKDGFALPEALKPRFFDAPYRDMTSQGIYSFYCQLQDISMGPTEKAT